MIFLRVAVQGSSATHHSKVNQLHVPLGEAEWSFDHLEQVVVAPGGLHHASFRMAGVYLQNVSDLVRQHVCQQNRSSRTGQLVLYAIPEDNDVGAFVWPRERICTRLLTRVNCVRQGDYDGATP